MKQLIVLTLCLFLINSIHAGPDVLFDSANAYYGKQQFSEAVQKYEEILRQGLESEAVYFNLGNAYYKSGELASAIINYERALQIDPADEDVLFNLKLANLRIVDRVEPIKGMLISKFWGRILRLNSADSWAILLLAFIWGTMISISMILLTSSIQHRRIYFLSSVLFLGLSLLTATITYQQNYFEQHRNFGIMFSKSSYAKSAPDDKSTDLFIIHEGLKVEVIDRLKGWLKIRLQDGNQGWILDEDLSLI